MIMIYDQLFTRKEEKNFPWNLYRVQTRVTIIEMIYGVNRIHHSPEDIHFPEYSIQRIAVCHADYSFFFLASPFPPGNAPHIYIQLDSSPQFLHQHLPREANPPHSHRRKLHILPFSGFSSPTDLTPLSILSNSRERERERERDPSLTRIQFQTRAMEQARESLVRKTYFADGGGGAAAAAPAATNPKFSRSISHAADELQSFRNCLRWMCLDQSDFWSASFSWSVFVLLALVVPAVSHFVLACSSCDSTHERPFDRVVQISLSGVASLSFLCLSRFGRKYGLRRFLFFDRLCHDSDTVRQGYTMKLDRSLKLLAIFVLPCFVAESAYKIWWYGSGASQIPFLGDVLLSDTVACAMELLSWLYRTTIFFLVCVLFHLICHLQILRLQDFAKFFEVDSDMGDVLYEHLKIRKHLRIISHRYRSFMLCTLIMVTGSQFASLLATTKTGAIVDVYGAGELALCSMTLVAGILILLRSATKITHKAQAVTCLAAKWNVCATLERFDATEGETPTAAMVADGAAESETETDEAGDEEDELDNSKIIHAYAYSTLSFQKRQALVSYFENNRAGITVYGFTLDRTTLHSIFGFELALVLWLLGKTVGIS
ncbi:unnamed protein product [Linum tenue]|uniref:Uncharacterized protein n=1 Tax=Linum tenue TaxID=586396 RepID=A0AAV0LP60_9ROSI|nr:unnamed protein product [Linum tenue]